MVENAESGAKDMTSQDKYLFLSLWRNREATEQRTYFAGFSGGARVASQMPCSLIP